MIKACMAQAISQSSLGLALVAIQPKSAQQGLLAPADAAARFKTTLWGALQHC